MTESRIADIYCPLTDAWLPTLLSSLEWAPRERLPNGTMHLPGEERERIRNSCGEAVLADVEAVAHGLLHGRDLPREREAAENCRKMYPHEYAFPCALASADPKIGDTPAFDRLRSEFNSLSEKLAAAECSVFLAFNRSHAVVRTSRPLSDDERNRFKAVFAAFRQKGEPQGTEKLEALGRPAPALSEDDARELAWFRDLYERAHSKPAMLSNTTGQRWAIVDADELEQMRADLCKLQQAAEAAQTRQQAEAVLEAVGLPSGPGDTHSPRLMGFDSGQLVPLSDIEVVQTNTSEPPKGRKGKRERGS